MDAERGRTIRKRKIEGRAFEEGKQRRNTHPWHQRKEESSDSFDSESSGMFLRV